MPAITKALFLCLVIFIVSGVACNQVLNGEPLANSSPEKAMINPGGATIANRFNTPAGFEIVPLTGNSFGAYLRNLPLKPAGSKVNYYNGQIKDNGVYEAVIDMPISNKDLQQCADAIILLRGEYFYREKQYDKISFNFTNGFKADYSEWIKGKRITVNGNHVSWKNSGTPYNTYTGFRNYMEVVFSYAGTLSLSKSLQSKPLKDIAPGDVFIVGGSPGHAVIVVDVAVNTKGEKLFMLAQSYMPAQEIQILKNFNDNSISPWYSANFTGTLQTPEWTFNANQLKTWAP